MQPSDFTEDKSGLLARTPQGYWAFIPRPLPPKLTPTWSLTQTLSAADRALGELSGIARRLPNPHLLINPFMRREAVLSSRIEGTQASLSDLFLFEASAPASSPDVREVANYVRSLEHGLARLREIPLSVRLIRELHAKLMVGVRGEAMTPGEFRRSQSWIGPPGSTISTATYVPPPIVEMNEALSRFEKYLNEPSELPPLVRIAMSHYQFEAIHPFLDGNGRVGRLLISLLLCRDKLLEQPLLYLSAYFEKNRAEYYARLLNVSQRGEWAEWLKYFLTGVVEQADDAIWRTGQLLALWQKYRRKFQATKSSSRVLELIDSIFDSPVISISAAAKSLGVTARAAAGNIEKLVAAGVLREITGRERNRVYVAQTILATIDSERKIQSS